LAIAFNKNFDFEEIHIYLSGIVVFGFLGLITIRRLQKIEIGLDLFQFHGHAYEHPKIALIFLIACLGVTGFPISPTFLGEDLIFSHIEASQFLLAFFVASSFILDGLAIIRIYSRIFLGPHIKTYHEVAYRSA
jgi:formate hydrogenlyase subunit 3/multisubunit Na+/H+ antiporter MnhD subunit